MYESEPPGLTNSKFPTPKSLMFEINAKPFAENQIISFEHFQTKYWLNEKIVLRLGIQLNNQKNEMAIEDWEEDANSTTPYIENSLLFGIKPDEFLIYGHTHKQYVDMENRVANPGCWRFED